MPFNAWPAALSPDRPDRRAMTLCMIVLRCFSDELIELRQCRRSLHRPLGGHRDCPAGAGVAQRPLDFHALRAACYVSRAEAVAGTGRIDLFYGESGKMGLAGAVVETASILPALDD